MILISFSVKSLDVKVETHTLKKYSISYTIKILQTFDFCDIWRIINLKTKLFTFRQKHFFDVGQCRLDYIFILKSLQETISNVCI